MINRTKDKAWKGLSAMRMILAIPIIIAIMVFPVPVWAESSVPQEDVQGESQLPLVIAQVQPESGSEKIDDDSIVIDDLEDLEEGEQALEDESVIIADPLQPWNRMWHHFNDKTYFWMFKPIAQGYRVVVPEGFRVSFSNFYTNATAPVRIFNSLFQLKIEYFFKEFARFLINTTVGFVGFRDCAKDCFGIKPHDEDFGQTLGHYGIGHGIYLVWPLLGPSSVRDTIGKGADSVLSFTGILSPVDLEVPVWAGLKTHEIVNDISLRIGDYERLKDAAIDPYIAIRDGYVQRRKKAVQE
ncbi:MAG: VacJ family lipoprotein [Deltaproteobacteria bacterium]|nr:VacJ family lipoprotein [Deltaproteobacteria bacterium]